MRFRTIACCWMGCLFTVCWSSGTAQPAFGQGTRPLSDQNYEEFLDSLANRLLKEEYRPYDFDLRHTDWCKGFGHDQLPDSLVQQDPSPADQAANEAIVADESTPLAEVLTSRIDESTPLAEESRPLAEESTTLAEESTPVVEESIAEVMVTEGEADPAAFVGPPMPPVVDRPHRAWLALVVTQANQAVLRFENWQQSLARQWWAQWEVAISDSSQQLAASLRTIWPESVQLSPSDQVEPKALAAAIDEPAPELQHIFGRGVLPLEVGLSSREYQALLLEVWRELQRQDTKNLIATQSTWYEAMANEAEEPLSSVGHASNLSRKSEGNWR